MARNLFARDHLDLFNARMDKLLEPNDTLALGFFVDSILWDTTNDYVANEVLKNERLLTMVSTAHFDVRSWRELSPDWRGIYSFFKLRGMLRNLLL